LAEIFSFECLVQWFPKWAVLPPEGGEAEMGDWGTVKQKWAVGGR